jgi:hypothetical protein
MIASRTSIAGMTLMVLAGAAAAQIQLRPGQYAATVHMDFAGTTMTDQQTECITAEDLKDFPKKMLMDPEHGSACKITNYAINAAKVTFDMTCDEDGLRMTSRVEMTFTADSFAGASTSKDNRGRTTTLKLAGKRVGDCRP